MSTEAIPLDKARSRLAKLWLGGSGVVFFIVLLQSFGTIYRGRLAEVWGLTLSTFLPTLSLIVSVLGASAIDSQATTQNSVQVPGVRRDFYAIAYWLSAAYFVIITVTILAQPAVMYFQSPEPSMDEVLKESKGDVTAADVLKMSNLWLSPFQGLVIAAMGTLFFTKKSASEKENPKKGP
jgi:hypothetical protein